MPQTESAETAALLSEASPETRSRLRVVNIVVTVAVVAIVGVTLVSSIVFHSGFNSLVANAFFATTLSLIVISQGLMLFWYRRGELHPKFRYYLYFGAFSTVLMCIAGNLFYHLPAACPDPSKCCP